jgi:hypothetical protein
MSDPVSTAVELRPGRYRHYKGKEYRVFHVARHSETMQPMVVYQTLYGDFSWWVRPLEMFTEFVGVDGRRVRRFEFVAEE